MDSVNRQHLEDSDLVRLAADEMDIEERSIAGAHIESCDACARRLGAVRAELGRVNQMLAGMDVPALDPARRERSLDAVRQAARRKTASTTAAGASTKRPARWFGGSRFAGAGNLARAAMVAGLLFAGSVVATATPVGDWVAGLWSGLVQQERAAPVGTASAVPAHGSTVAFHPKGDALAVELRSAQDAGTLTIRLEDSPTASAKVTGGTGDVDVIVLPEALRIENRQGMAADYSVVVPAHLERLTVRIGDRPGTVLRPAELGAGWSTTVDLASPEQIDTP